MRHRGKLLVGVFAVAAAVLVGCSERSTPTEVAPTTAPSFARSVKPSSAGHDLVQSGLKVLRRHGAPTRTWTSRVITPNGGEMDLAAAGLRVVFPRGAVTEPVRITVSTASSGGVAYEFQPHGLRFQVPVTVQQDLVPTEALQNHHLVTSIDAVYFDGDVDAGTANLLEYRPLTVDADRGTASFTIEHFSGYLISVGRRGGR